MKTVVYPTVKNAFLLLPTIVIEKVSGSYSITFAFLNRAVEISF